MHGHDYVTPRVKILLSQFYNEEVSKLSTAPLGYVKLQTFIHDNKNFSITPEVKKRKKRENTFEALQ